MGLLSIISYLVIVGVKTIQKFVQNSSYSLQLANQLIWILNRLLCVYYYQQIESIQNNQVVKKGEKRQSLEVLLHENI